MDYKEKIEILTKFQNNAFKDLKRLENERQRRLWAMIIIETILVVSVFMYIFNFLAVFEFIFNKLGSPLLLLGPWIGILCIIIFIFYYPFRVYSNFKQKLKTLIMPKVVKYLENINYAYKQSIFSNKELQIAICLNLSILLMQMIHSLEYITISNLRFRNWNYQESVAEAVLQALKVL